MIEFYNHFSDEEPCYTPDQIWVNKLCYKMLILCAGDLFRYYKAERTIKMDPSQRRVYIKSGKSAEKWLDIKKERLGLSLRFVDVCQVLGLDVERVREGMIKIRKGEIIYDDRYYSPEKFLREDTQNTEEEIKQGDRLLCDKAGE